MLTRAENHKNVKIDNDEVSAMREWLRIVCCDLVAGSKHLPAPGHIIRYTFLNVNLINLHGNSRQIRHKTYPLTLKLSMTMDKKYLSD